MHILVLNFTFRGYGDYWRALQFARQLHARGHRVTLMCAARDKRYRARRMARDGFVMFETPHWAPGVHPQEGWGPLDLIFRCARVLAERVDLVFSFSHKPTTTVPARLARLRWGCPWVSDWCDLWGGPEGLFRRFVLSQQAFRSLPPAVRAWRRFLFRREERMEQRVRRTADLITVICSDLARRARDLGIAPERVLLLPSGAPVDAISPADKIAARRLLGLSDSAFTLGYMANYHHDEDLLLAAFARLLQRVPDAVLLVMGPPFDHPQRLLTETQIALSICHLGRVEFEHISPRLAAADALVMPLSDTQFNRGRWPNKIGDYLAAGRPVVTTAVGDAPGLVQEHDLGWIGPPTAEGLAEAMGRAWEERARWDEIGRRGRRVAETVLSYAALTDRLIDAVRRQTGLDLRRP